MQTYSVWELIICDDGSTDASYAVAEQYAKRFAQKVILIKNEKNMGLNFTLNHCFEYAHGDFIARMDGDDVCSPERFEIELKELEKHPEIAFVSTDMEYFDETGIWGRISHPVFPNAGDLAKFNPFCHAPCMIRREALKSVNGYTIGKRLLRVEDYHLWIKLYACGFKGMNIHLPLYQMRDDFDAYKRRDSKTRRNEAYVRRLAVKELHLPKWMLVYSLRPLLVGILPQFVYRILHKRRLKKR